MAQFNPIDEIRKKSREEWETLAQDKVRDVRIWVQENGEKAFAGGLIVGMFFILFFKLFLGIVIFGGLLTYAVWYTAIPSNGKKPEDRGGNPS